MHKKTLVNHNAASKVNHLHSFCLGMTDLKFPSFLTQIHNERYSYDKTY